MAHEFNGFGPALRFLGDLAENNNRDWFETNKARYEEDVREPARAFVRAMAPRLVKVSREFVADDRRVGGSIMRINRDVRFAKDKSPYKTNLGIQFRHRTGKDVHAPGLYVHIQPGLLFLGSGMWQPEPDALHALRTAIAVSPARWRKIVDDPSLMKEWRQGGSSLKRPPKGFVADHPNIEDLKRTDFILDSQLNAADVKSADLVGAAATAFVMTQPYLKFLCSALKIAC